MNNIFKNINDVVINDQVNNIFYLRDKELDYHFAKELIANKFIEVVKYKANSQAIYKINKPLFYDAKNKNDIINAISDSNDIELFFYNYSNGIVTFSSATNENLSHIFKFEFNKTNDFFNIETLKKLITKEYVNFEYSLVYNFIKEVIIYEKTLKII